MEIVDRLESLLAKGQDSALLRYGLGNEYLKAEDYERAAGQLAEAVRQDPAYSAAWKLYGRALAGAGRHGEAVSAFERGIAAAELKGDVQAAKEMRVFRRRSEQAARPGAGPA
jgi:Tfp pilus assembly protein PilF